MTLSRALLIFPFLALPAVAEPVTVLALGDSLTQGYGLPEGDGFVPQLQAWLTDHGAEVTLINGGVSGDTTAGGAARIAWSLTEDVDAVIVALGGNDLLRGIAPEEMRANLDTILTEIGNRDLPALLVGVEATGNFGPAYKTAFDNAYPTLAEAHGVALYPNFLAALIQARDAGTAPTSLMQSDGMHPNPQGVALIVEDMGPSVLSLVQDAR